MIKCLLVSIHTLVFFAVGSVHLGQIHAQDVEWVREYMSEFDPEFDLPFAMKVDASGNAYITGAFSGPNQLPDMVTIKYNSLGEEEWVARYHGPGDSWDIGRAIAIDALGNVYVTGETHSEATDFDYATIKYTASGEQEWVTLFNSADDSPRAIAVDPSGNVYVTGYGGTTATFYDYVTIKYNGLGEEQWVEFYNGPGNTKDQASALALDAAGNVYVTGSSGEGSPNRSDYVTIKYDPSGVQQWVGRYSNFWDYATAIDVDASANVYVTGYSYQIGTYYDYTTVKYNAMGVQQWVRRFNGPGTSDDLPYALKVDASGNVIVTGDAFFEIDHGSDYGTVKYSPSGNELWVARYDGPGNATDIAYGLALDAAGDIYVTGGSRGEDLVDDYATIKYSASGVEQWSIRHSDEGEVYDLGQAVGVDGSGNVYVTGYASRLGGRLCTTIKYAQGSATTVQNEWGPRGGYALKQDGPNPFQQRTMVRYSLGAEEHTSLKVFNVRGEEVTTLVDGIRGAGDGMVEWDATGMPSGVYFLRMQAGDFTETKRVILLR